MQNNLNSDFGSLFIVSTPIGNLDDITFRAISTLKSVDLIASEDTRRTKKLLTHFSINQKIISVNDHNEQQKSEIILNLLREGKSIALVSDAGTPLISDPGFYLVRMCLQNKIKVVPIPGACAAISALSVSGISTFQFCFQGFLPAKKTQRIQALNALKNEARTMIFYESPHRILDSLNDLMDVFGKNRQMTFVRELTKIWETILHDSTENIVNLVKNDSNQQKGEMVLIVEGFQKTIDTNISDDVIKTFELLQNEIPPKKAVKIAAEIHQIDKKVLYQFVTKKT